MSSTHMNRVTRRTTAIAGIVAAALLGACATSSQPTDAQATNHAATNYAPLTPTLAPTHMSGTPNWQRLAAIGNNTNNAQPTSLGAGDRLGRAVFERFQAAGVNTFAAVQPD
ncbi:MAG: hypothetical protein AAF297_01080 [Planctomycetota bacterium]